MERGLNLIKNDAAVVEKRVFPRFPYSFLTFKGQKDHQHAFEVKDISFTGMQISLRNGGHNYQEGAEITGVLHWKGRSLDTSGKVKWVAGERLGVSFSESKKLQEELRKFLCIENIIAGMRPIHETSLDIEIPANLKYWLRSDGPFEIFVWQHADGEISKFQVIALDQFVEWKNGEGLSSGKVLRQRDVDTPLSTMDEFTFQIDESTDAEKTSFAYAVINQLTPNLIHEGGKEFLLLKLGQ